MRRSLLVLTFALGCTDAGLYDAKRPPIEANRVAVTGTVCTEDPELAKFPVRVVVVADQAAGALYGDYDAAGLRLRGLTNLINSALQKEEYALSVVGYGATATKLAPEEGFFGRNPGELLNAVNRLSIPQPCGEQGYCRDYGEGLRVAGNLIEDDMAQISAGERGLTQYVIVLVNAGPHQPMADARECCARGDAACRNRDPQPSASCQGDRDAARVAQIRDSVLDGGGGGFEMHIVHLAAEEDGAVNESVAQGHERMAFVGGGRYQRVENVNTLDFKALRVFDRQNSLRAKHFIVSNRNAAVYQGSMYPDSDGDGLPDVVERDNGTDPLLWDTDGDNVGDLVEILTSVDPLSPDVFDQCADLETPGRDSDRDGLANCEESLLGTDPSMADTDGDGLPDGMELASGTDYLNRDGVVDDDGDGVSNGDEVREHTDPRMTDLPARLGSAYRYTMEDLGLVSEATIDGPDQITGVRVLHVSNGSTAGVGILDFAPGDGGSPGTLKWKDAADGEHGALVELPAERSGVVEVRSSSYEAVQGESARYVRLEIQPTLLPPRPLSEPVRVVKRQRHCIKYIVRNIRLLETLTETNELMLYFAESPTRAQEAPGPFRIAQLPIRFIPPALREPSGAMLTVLDEEFVHYPRRESN